MIAEVRTVARNHTSKTVMFLCLLKNGIDSSLCFLAGRMRHLHRSCSIPWSLSCCICKVDIPFPPPSFWLMSFRAPPSDQYFVWKMAMFARFPKSRIKRLHVSELDARGINPTPRRLFVSLYPFVFHKNDDIQFKMQEHRDMWFRARAGGQTIMPRCHVRAFFQKTDYVTHMCSGWMLIV